MVVRRRTTKRRVPRKSLRRLRSTNQVTKLIRFNINHGTFPLALDYPVSFIQNAAGQIVADTSITLLSRFFKTNFNEANVDDKLSVLDFQKNQGISFVIDPISVALYRQQTSSAQTKFIDMLPSCDEFRIESITMTFSTQDFTHGLVPVNLFLCVDQSNVYNANSITDQRVEPLDKAVVNEQVTNYIMSSNNFVKLEIDQNNTTRTISIKRPSNYDGWFCNPYPGQVNYESVFFTGIASLWCPRLFVLIEYDLFYNSTGNIPQYFQPQNFIPIAGILPLYVDYQFNVSCKGTRTTKPPPIA